MIHYLIILFGISCVGSQNLMLPKGSPCTWNGTAGQCVSVYRCESAVSDIVRKKHPPICSFEDKTPVICCTDCVLVKDTRLSLFNPLLGIIRKSGTSKAKDKCLDYIHTLDYPCKMGLQPLILAKRKVPPQNCTYLRFEKNPALTSGGRSALRGEFPHMALLGYGATFDTAEWLCGGSVISEFFILTAAHCLSSLRAGAVKYVGMGILKRSDPSKIWLTDDVKRAIPHPGYKSPSTYHDIALLETKNKILFSSQVLPACLHTQDTANLFAEAVGWGALGPRNDLSDVLQSVKLQRFSEEECSKQYPKHRNLINGIDESSQLCYGDTEQETVPTDTCKGDSGGPLQYQDDEMCASSIVGVTSNGKECGAVGGAGIYTRVSYYVPWIEDIVWP